MSNKVKEWPQRGLTLLGKVLISKTISISNIVYSLSYIVCQEEELKEAQRLFNNYILVGKPSTIRCNILRQELENYCIKL